MPSSTLLSAILSRAIPLRVPCFRVAPSLPLGTYPTRINTSTTNYEKTLPTPLFTIPVSNCPPKPPIFQLSDTILLAQRVLESRSLFRTSQSALSCPCLTSGRHDARVCEPDHVRYVEHEREDDDGHEAVFRECCQFLAPFRKRKEGGTDATLNLRMETRSKTTHSTGKTYSAICIIV